MTDTSRTMRALVLHGKEDLRFERRDVLRPGPGEVRVEIGSVGVCGSDKHFYLEGRASSDIVSEPLVLGHEFGGRIVEVGPGGDEARVGQRVSVEPLMADPLSPQARRGSYNLDPGQRFFGVPGTDGALQQYLNVPAENAFDIPDSMSDDAAAMVETISVSLNGVRKAGVSAGSRILITGGGPIGLFAAQLAFLQGASRVVLVEPQSERRAKAASFGCEVSADLASVDELFDAVIECTGVGVVRHDSCLKVAPGGRAIFIGVGAQDASIPMPAIIEREVSVQGVMRYAFTWPTVIDAVATGRIDADSLVSRTLPFDRAIEAWTVPLTTEVKTMIHVNR
ncbi:alcohol dehydrogenase catalytic domain-containing protein [Microbacterium sp. Se63.02b]|uniref:alcohol dehydrogenase catalytic domain-containing protein n=1 Tax=Microbacterium sp. Se63.02b TaxID=2709304 RepID=UPI001AEEF42D|nr:alcohol dehydrogenase catalytic domain-containing protein [Microbacterium sp. Se63.02b]